MVATFLCDILDMSCQQLYLNRSWVFYYHLSYQCSFHQNKMRNGTYHI